MPGRGLLAALALILCLPCPASARGPAQAGPAVSAAGMPSKVFEAVGPIMPVELSVMTYNVEGLPWPIRSWRGMRLRAIGRELAALRELGLEPDVVLLQEGFRDEMPQLIRISGYPHVARGPLKDQRDAAKTRPDRKRFQRVRYFDKGEGWGKWGSSGLWVLSNHPINGVKSHAYSYCAGLDCLANKGVMLVSLTVPGLPTPVEIANTHLNSKGSSGVPHSRHRMAHHLQADELKAFMDQDRAPGSPLIVGGDFNVRRAPDRYDYVMARYPFEVVSQTCRQMPQNCDVRISGDGDAPWLDTQDLIGFKHSDQVTIRPIRVEARFDGSDTAGPAFSDHDAYQVTFRLTPVVPAKP